MVENLVAVEVDVFYTVTEEIHSVAIVRVPEGIQDDESAIQDYLQENFPQEVRDNSDVQSTEETIDELHLID